jgi:UDP-glucose 4-epimerase
VNLAFGTRTDLLDLVARLEAVLGHPVEVTHTEPRPGDVRHSTADGSRLAALFPDLAPVDLDTGLRATVDWFRGS